MICSFILKSFELICLIFVKTQKSHHKSSCRSDGCTKRRYTLKFIHQSQFVLNKQKIRFSFSFLNIQILCQSDKYSFFFTATSMSSLSSFQIHTHCLDTEMSKSYEVKVSDESFSLISYDSRAIVKTETGSQEFRPFEKEKNLVLYVVEFSNEHAWNAIQSRTIHSNLSLYIERKNLWMCLLE